MNDNNPITKTEGKPSEPEDKQTSSKSRRQICPRCKRPLPPACICEGLPEAPIALDKSCIVVLQHPHELKRKNRSIPILELCLDSSSLALCVGRKFGKEHMDPKVSKLLEPPNLPILFFPPEKDETNVYSLSEAKQVLSENPPEQPGKVVIIALDATWKYAKEMHRANVKDNLYPSNLMRVCLQPSDFPDDWKSGRFNIRTTPEEGGGEGFMSTVECLAWAASELDDCRELFGKLMKPLDLMVSKWNAFVQQPKIRPKKAPRKRQREEEESES